MTLRSLGIEEKCVTSNCIRLLAAACASDSDDLKEFLTSPSLDSWISAVLLQVGGWVVMFVFVQPTSQPQHVLAHSSCFVHVSRFAESVIQYVSMFIPAPPPRPPIYQSENASLRTEVSLGLLALAVHSRECAVQLAGKLLSFLPQVDDAATNCAVCLSAQSLVHLLAVLRACTALFFKTYLNLLLLLFRSISRCAPGSSPPSPCKTAGTK